MDEILQKLLEAEILTEENKKELEETFKAQLEEATQAAKDDTAATVRTELTEQWITERDVLVEAVDTKVTEFLAAEIDELKEDINRFRDLELEYAEKVVENKAALRSELKEDMTGLIEKIESFLEIRLAAEMEELKEDIEQARKNEFGRKIVETFADEFKTHFLADEDSLHGELAETRNRLEDTQGALVEAEKRANSLERSAKLEEVLNPLEGRARDVMEAILKSVATDQLEDGYKTFIGRVVRETTEDETSEKEDKVLAEDASPEGDEDSKKKLEEGKLVTGDDEQRLDEDAVESAKQQQLSEAAKQRIQRLAGITG